MFQGISEKAGGHEKGAASTLNSRRLTLNLSRRRDNAQ